MLKLRFDGYISGERLGISTFTFTIKACFRRIYNKESLENNKIHIKMLISPPQFALTGRFLASEHFSSIW